jgi:tight adherence protein C
MAPLGPKQSDRLRKRLVLAGYHSRSATTIFTGIRLAAAAALSLLVAGMALYAGQTLNKTVLLALCAACFGFALPTILLSRYIDRRSQRLPPAVSPSLQCAEDRACP